MSLPMEECTGLWRCLALTEEQHFANLSIDIDAEALFTVYASMELQCFAEIKLIILYLDCLRI